MKKVYCLFIGILCIAALCSCMYGKGNTKTGPFTGVYSGIDVRKTAETAQNCLKSEIVLSNGRKILLEKKLDGLYYSGKKVFEFRSYMDPKGIGFNLFDFESKDDYVNAVVVFKAENGSCNVFVVDFPVDFDKSKVGETVLLPLSSYDGEMELNYTGNSEMYFNVIKLSLPMTSRYAQGAYYERVKNTEANREYYTFAVKPGQFFEYQSNWYTVSREFFGYSEQNVDSEKIRITSGKARITGTDGREWYLMENDKNQKFWMHYKEALTDATTMIYNDEFTDEIFSLYK